MSGLVGFGKELFMTIFWVFFVLVVGFILLAFLSNHGVPGAAWVEQHAQPQ